MPKITVVAKLPKRLADRIAKMRHVGERMQGNAYFPSPPVRIATYLAHVAEAETAQVAMLNRGLGAKSKRNAKLAVPEGELALLVSYVMGIANQSPGIGLAIVASSGLEVKDSKGPRRRGLTVAKGPEPGSVRLSMDHPGGDAFFSWYVSTDGKRYVLAKQTTPSKTVLTGLTPLQWHWFQVAVAHKGSPGDPSAPIKFFVE